ncbi:MAG: alpha/beta fold hydrolase [Bacteroidota bacterium]
MKTLILKALITILIIYLVVCSILYFIQEKLIFFPEKLSKDYKYVFNQRFEEMNIKTGDAVMLNGLLFKADTSKGLIFYLHGNAGSLKSWGEIAKTYTDLGYDLFMLDYRGYGKSEGKINSEGELHKDIQTVYNELRSRYDEKKIIVLGYSMGTGAAAKLASSNSPNLLILQAPYYSLTDMMKHNYPIIPTFILKYKLETNKYLKDCRMPVIIFHGDRDEVIYYKSSIKLKELFKSGDTLVTLKGQPHNGMSDNPEYLDEISRILNR